MILLTLCSIVWDWRVSRAGPMPFYWPSCLVHFVFYCFSFLFFPSIGWYCGAGVFGLIGRLLLSPSPSSPPFFNNTINYYYFKSYPSIEHIYFDSVICFLLKNLSLFWTFPHHRCSGSSMFSRSLLCRNMFFFANIPSVVCKTIVYFISVYVC